MTERNKDIFWIGDRYCALFKIGAGGMGEVWAGKSIGDQGFERVVAIKRLHPDKRRRESLHRAIFDEATVLQHLSVSPNIVSVIDLRVEDGQPSLIMEYVDGPELRDVLRALNQKNKKLPFLLTAYIVTEISKGLSSAHGCKHPKTGQPLNVVHRDVSPSNILLSSSGAVKLTDFGIAKSTVQTTETCVGEIKGKYQYMAPEQARGRKIDYRTDYFALGLILYECLVGKPAYEAETDIEFIERARNGKIILPGGISDDLRAILKRLLAFDRDKRYDDLEQFRRDIGQIAIGRGGIATSDDLAQFLDYLDLPQLKEAVERRIYLEQARDLPDHDDAAETGIFTPDKRAWVRSRWFKTIAATVLLGVAAVLSYSFVFNRSPGSDQSFFSLAQRTHGSLTVETNPEDAIVLLRYGNRKIESPSPASFRDIPLDTPLKVSAQKADFIEVSDELTLTKDSPSITRTFDLKKKPLVRVRFTANPPSSFTIPGRIANQDAPSPLMSLPAGRYSVIFSNPLATSKAHTTLDARNGGSFICKANMEIDLAARAPTGKKPKAYCQQK